MSCPGIPVDDSAAAFSVCKSAAFLDELRGKGLPVTGAYLVPEGASTPWSSLPMFLTTASPEK